MYQHNAALGLSQCTGGSVSAQNKYNEDLTFGNLERFPMAKVTMKTTPPVKYNAPDSKLVPQCNAGMKCMVDTHIMAQTV